MSRIEDGVGFPITAVDQFTGAFNALKDRVSGMQSEFGRLNGVIAGFTGGLGLASFATFIKGAADAQDQIYKLSQKVGIAVGDLSTFAYAGKLSDVSAESLARGVKSLSQKMIEAGDATSKAGQLMKVMGVDARGQTLPAIEKMADVFKNLPDGPTKAALAVEMFGKAGMDMIPLLNQGSEGIRKMREEAERLGLKMNDETAKAAEQFNDNLRAVKASADGLGVTLLNATAPALVRISAAMKEAAADGGVLKAVWVGMGGAMAEAFGLNDDPTAKRIKALSNEISELQAKIAKGPADLGGGVQDRGYINQYIERVKVLQAELRAAKALQDAMEGKFGDQVSRAAAARKAPAGGPSEATISGILTGGKASEDALREAERLRQLDLRGWVAYAEAVFKEADETNLAMAKVSEEYWKNEEKLRDEDLKGWVAYADSVFKEADELNLAMAKISEDRNKEEESRWSGYINGIEGAFRQGWDAFTGGAKNAGEVARDALKRTLFDWLWQQFAKPFVLNIVASTANALGISGLGSAATAASGGGLSGLGGLFSSPLGMTVGGVGIAAALYSMFRDKGENPNFRWTQGTGGQGAFGGISTQGNFGFDSAALQQIVGAIDSRVARILGPSGVATATSGLQAYTATGLRADGQPAQFAIPRGSEAEGAEQIAKELLQSRYGILFEGIDAGIAAKIKEWSGSSTDLQQYITSALDVIDALSGLNVRGLNITTLQAMTREGESLGQTFDRVSGQWTTFNDLFTTDAEKLQATQSLVSKTFESLGIAVPASMEDFRKLVEGIDLTTEAGRTLWGSLMQVAPAFAAVSNAATALLKDFDSVMSRLRGPAYTNAMNQTGLQGAAQQFMSGNAWTAGMSWQEVVAAVKTITKEDFSNYSAESQKLILDILGYTADLADSSDALSSSMGKAASATSSYASALQAARDGLKQWAMGKLLGESSTLLPAEKLDLALSQYEKAVGKKDIGGFQSAADALLEIARSYYASGDQYTEIFKKVMADAEKLGGFSLGLDKSGPTASINQMRQELKAQLVVQNAQMADVKKEVVELIKTLRDTSASQTKATYEAAATTARAVVGAVESVAR